MGDHSLFALINASPGMGRGQLWAATALAEWVIYLIPVALLWAWWRGTAAARRELMEMLLATLLALALAQAVAHVWPQPRPFMLHLGTQYLLHSADAGLPSDHVTVFWSLAFAAFASRSHGTWAFPLLAAGLMVGWSRVYLGVHFPFDVLAALPVALTGAVLARLARHRLSPVFEWMIGGHEKFETFWRSRSRSTRAP
jgi:undecaprenyl-diphosphatase